MGKNYTPLDVKKLQKKHSGESVSKEKHSSKLDSILVSIIIITFVVLGVMLFMLYQKSV